MSALLNLPYLCVMRFIVTSEHQTPQLVELHSDAQAFAGESTVILRPTDRANLFHATMNGHTIPVIITSDGVSAVHITVNGYRYDVDVYQEQHHALLTLLNASTASHARSVKVSAPMPGLIKSIMVQEGGTVRKGDVLFTLEAMKMENAIKSPLHGMVRTIAVQEGTAVEKGVLLCVVESVAT